MVNTRGDQAEGLRRMLSFSTTRTIAIVAGTRGAGATTCTVNLASALARHGSRVLIVDENFDANVAAALGVRPRHDLKHVIARDCALEDALVQAPGGISLMAAASLVRALPRLDQRSQAKAIDCFAELDELADLVLLDARNDGLDASPFASAAQEVILVVSPGASAITGAYAAVKRMSRTDGRQRFRLIVNRAHDSATVRVVETNMREAAKKHLDVALEAMGAIPHDPSVIVSTRRFSAVLDSVPAAAASQAFCELAAAILRWSAPRDSVSRLDTFMQRAIYGSRFRAAHAGV